MHLMINIHTTGYASVDGGLANLIHDRCRTWNKQTWTAGCIHSSVNKPREWVTRL